MDELSIAGIILDVKKKITVPKGKYLDIVILSIKEDLVFEDFPEEDEELLEDILEKHVVILGYRKSSIRISDNFYFLDNLEDVPDLYGYIKNEATTRTYITFYRTVKDIKYKQEEIEAKIEEWEREREENENDDTPSL